MKIFKVIHGYPMRYNAGSEVYSQMLCQGLATKHEVHVFTRQENPFFPDYILHKETDPEDPRIKLHIINLVTDRHRYRYRHPTLDKKFAELLEEIKPDIVHIGHLNHLSTSLIYEINNRNIPIVFTLHDYWLMCPRGQFMQRNSHPLWAACDKQSNDKCAIKCYAGCASGARQEWEQDISYWQDWVARRMEHIKAITKLVDYFIAPSQYLYNRFTKDFGLPKEKAIYLDYGFDLSRFAIPRQRPTKEPFTFGYIGTHIPAKGIQYLINAFALLKGHCKLRIWGRHNANTVSLKALWHELASDLTVQERIEWLPEYQNSRIMHDVFNKVDCIVVPSIWVENSPLVIHEALQARVPVITADVGGMAEYINHGINGLLFKHRDVESLANRMQTLLDNPAYAAALGTKGYLQAESGNIPDMPAHILKIEAIYRQILSSERKSTHAG